MQLSEFAHILYPYLSNGSKPCDFLRELLEHIADGTEDKNLDAIYDMTPDSLNRVYNGKLKLARTRVSALLSHLDKLRFSGYVNDRLTLDAAEELRDRLSGVGITSPDISVMCAEIFAEVLRESISPKKKKGTCETTLRTVESHTSQVPVVSVFTNSELRKELWEAAKISYLASHSKGNRFHTLNIIERLLPQGYISDRYFQTRGETEDGTIAPLTELCARIDSDIAIVGDGGIGKTTFLQRLLKEEFLFPNGDTRAFTGESPVPFFIELNRCPDHIGNWYDSSLRKTNFITRYIGQIRENHRSLDSVSPETLILVEKEMQRIPSDGKPQYLLLLDGFNEVRADNSVRTNLSNEILALHQYPNVRIITTSRETQAAYYAREFENIRLVGLKTEDIKAYLESCEMPEPFIGEALHNESLIRCLRIPLYICMFSAQGKQNSFLPETAGEILYSFFHRDSAFYNARRRIAETQTSRLADQQIAFILDFILPYIGWAFEGSDTFYMNEHDFLEAISDGMRYTKSMLTRSSKNPFADFKYSGPELSRIVDTFYHDGNLEIDSIVACVYDYLGIVYQYQIDEGDFADRIRFAFCHHHFRDYFSAMWDVRLLSMLQCISVNDFSDLSKSVPCASFRYFLDEQYWQTQKVSFISEILMEHRNRPRLDSKTQNWFLPKPSYDEQWVLTRGLDYCRSLFQNHVETKHILQNILAAILCGRKDFSGLNLSGLDLRACCFFNITCSRPGKTRPLAAVFDGSTLSRNCFSPEDHQNLVMEYVYHGRQCFTIDDAGMIKCWDMLSGRLEYELQSADPLGVTDFSSKGFIKVSKDGHWLAAKVQETYPGGTHVYVQLFDLTSPGKEPKQIRPSEEHNLLTYFAFTEDSHGILLLCDRKIVYCMDVETGKQHYRTEFTLYKQTELYADSAESDILAFTAEYNTYETDEALMSTWLNDDDESEEDDWDYNDDETDEIEFPQGIPCELCSLNPKTAEYRVLLSFVGEPGTSPTVTYFPKDGFFLLYNHDGMHIEKFDCIAEQSEIVLDALTVGHDTPPTEIHPHPEHDNECFVMYRNVCFVVDIGPNSGGDVLMTYPIAAVEKLLPNSDQSGELEFKTAVAPTLNRFIVGNDTNTYEWDTGNDTITRKYNCAYFECTAFFPNAEKTMGLLIHRHNGVSRFEGIQPKLRYQYCFQEPEYVVDNSCFDEVYGILAMVFARPDHEKIIIVDLKTGEERTIFSSVYTGETIENMCFNEDGNYLLITTQYRCLECQLDSGNLEKVMDAGDNERLVAGNFRGVEIEIAVVEHSSQEEPRIQPYCVYYRRSLEQGKRTYHRAWYYLMPELEKGQFQYFIYQNGDLGVGGSNDKDGFQTYWATSGFFLERLPELDRFFQPKSFSWQGESVVEFTKEFKPLDEIFVWHKSAIANRYGVGNSGFCYMYLADDRSEAIITDNRKYLSYQNPLSSLTYERMRQIFDQNFQDVHRDTYWDFAIPWSDGNLIGCFESYNLMRVTSSNNTLLDHVEYYPGISIAGCKFKGIQTDRDTQEIIAANGGIM